MRKLRRLHVAAILPLLVALPGGCARDAGQDADIHADTTGLMESAEQTQELLAPVRAAALLIVEYGQVAAQRAGRPDVRMFGQTVATDHRALVAVLDSVGSERGATLHETDAARELAHTVRMAHAGLDNMSAEAFDLAFVRAEVESHRQLLDRLDHDLIPAASSNNMQVLLQDVRGTVEAHLTRARQLLGNLLGEPVEPPPGGAPPAPPVETPPPAPSLPDTMPDTMPGAAG
jgi:predicted outer membrane protein